MVLEVKCLCASTITQSITKKLSATEDVKTTNRRCFGKYLRNGCRSVFMTLIINIVRILLTLLPFLWVLFVYLRDTKGKFKDTSLGISYVIFFVGFIECVNIGAELLAEALYGRR